MMTNEDCSSSVGILLADVDVAHRHVALGHKDMLAVLNLLLTVGTACELLRA